MSYCYSCHADPCRCPGSDPLRTQWDEVDALLKAMPRSKQGMVYQTLYNLGWRVATVESETRHAWKEEQKPK